MQVLLAEDDAAGGAKPTDDVGVFVGDPTLVLCTGGGREHAGRVEDVFQPDGDAVEQAPVLATPDLLLGAASVLERGLGEDGDEGVELRA